METTPTIRRSGSVSWIGAIAGMLVTFLIGIYVGLHPAWIPLKGNTPSVNNPIPAGTPAPTTMPDDHHAPTIAPAMSPAMSKPPTTAM